MEEWSLLTLMNLPPCALPTTGHLFGRTRNLWSQWFSTGWPQGGGRMWLYRRAMNVRPSRSCRWTRSFAARFAICLHRKWVSAKGAQWKSFSLHWGTSSWCQGLSDMWRSRERARCARMWKRRECWRRRATAGTGSFCTVLKPKLESVVTNASRSGWAWLLCRVPKLASRFSLLRFVYKYFDRSWDTFETLKMVSKKGRNEWKGPS